MTRWAWLGHGVLVWSLCALALSAAAQTDPRPQTDARAAPAPSASVEVALVRDAVEHAHFDDAQSRAQALLASTSLSARERNDTLELLAVAQIAARREVLAQATLAELFARDPDHPERMRDPGPNVEAFFARVRAARRPSLSATLQVAALRDELGRVLIEVGLGESHDAIQTVHVFCRAGSAAAGATEQPDEWSQVVADVGAREQLQLALPAFSRRVTVLSLWLEARAPSGLVLAHDGSARDPLRVHLGPVQPDLSRHEAPLLRKWWLWTSVAILVSGLGVTGALVAQ
jgi:hypothetical protein